MNAQVSTLRHQASVFAGFSFVGLILLIVSGLLVKKQVEKSTQPLLQKLSDISHEEWFNRMVTWLKECPVKPTISLHKPIDITLK